MNDDAWRRHANPWSVWTRFAAVPAFVIAFWSRVWVGGWSLVFVAVLGLWLVVNPRAFAPVDVPQGWAAKGILGERIWLTQRRRVRRDHRIILRILIVTGITGFVLMAWGLTALDLWPTIAGGCLVIIAQLRRIDRMVRLFEEVTGD